jgi:thermitase
MRRLAVLAACWLVVLATPAAAHAARIVVVREPGVGAATVRAGAEKVKALPGLRAEVLRVPDAQRDATLARLNRLPGVRIAEVDGRVHAMGPDRSSEQWALPHVRAPDAWALSVGANVTVAVIDSGANLGHEDLPAARIAPGGHDWVDDDSTPSDQNGHGTHVATAIVGDRDNEGTNGIAPSARAMILRVLDAQGNGFDSDVAAAFDSAGDQGVRIASASLGGAAFSATLIEAIGSHPGTLYVIAAGNDGSDNDLVPTYPCNAPSLNVICVGASDQADQRAGFSNVGRISVDVFAPGVGILAGYIPGGSSFAELDGTSMATPIVSGIAALVLARTPAMSTLALKNAVLNGAVPLAGLDPLSVTGARADALRAIVLRPPDTDRDGIGDAWDDCTRAADAGQFDTDADGTGDACDDDDADGVPYSRDACPDLTALKSTNGCPETIDNDGDGVVDVNDDCPIDPGPAALGGCPRDSDDDGRIDTLDACPRQGASTDSGCPRPRIRSVRVRTARCGKRVCLKVRIRLAHSARITMTAQRCARRDGGCRWRTLVTRRRQARTYAVTLKLRPGRYRVRVVARNAEGKSRALSERVEIE